MSNSDARLTISDIIRELRERYGLEPAYSAVWRFLSEGHVAVKKNGTRLTIHETDLPAFATKLADCRRRFKL